MILDGELREQFSNVVHTSSLTMGIHAPLVHQTIQVLGGTYLVLTASQTDSLSAA